MQMEFKFVQGIIKFLSNVDLSIRYKCDGRNFCKIQFSRYAKGEELDR